MCGGPPSSESQERGGIPSGYHNAGSSLTELGVQPSFLWRIRGRERPELGGASHELQALQQGGEMAEVDAGSEGSPSEAQVKHSPQVVFPEWS